MSKLRKYHRRFHARLAELGEPIAEPRAWTQAEIDADRRAEAIEMTELAIGARQRGCVTDLLIGAE